MGVGAIREEYLGSQDLFLFSLLLKLDREEREAQALNSGAEEGKAGV